MRPELTIEKILLLWFHDLHTMPLCESYNE